MVDPVRLMTYNVRQALDSDGDNAWKHRREAVANTIRFHRPDLIGCQEVHYEQLEYLRN